MERLWFEPKGGLFGETRPRLVRTPEPEPKFFVKMTGNLVNISKRHCRIGKVTLK